MCVCVFILYFYDVLKYGNCINRISNMILVCEGCWSKNKNVILSF